MGDVGNFLFGGGTSKQTGSNTSTSSSGSSNQSQNTSVQGSDATSTQRAANASGSGNRSYGELAAALTPSLGYVSSAGNMMGSLLGLPTSTFKYTTAAPSVMPAAPAGGSGSGSGGGTPAASIAATLLQKYLSGLQVPAPTPTPTPSPTPTPTPTPVTPRPSIYGPMDPMTGAVSLLQHRAKGGPVNPGQPYVVGENRPEVFVPNQPGTILPSVPNAPGVMPTNPAATGGPSHRGMGIMTPDRTGLPTGIPGRGGGRGGFGGPPIPTPTPHPGPGVGGTGTPAATGYTSANPYNPAPANPAGALDTFADSAGMNFILDQGQKALSGASASNGTFNSGATGMALDQYGQNIGKTYLSQYMDQLMNYAKLGLGSASALSGAGGVSQGTGSSSGASNSGSFGSSQGTSSGSSTGIGSSTGSTSGNSNTKNGLLPALGSIGL